jgi:hypothetical protein
MLKSERKALDALIHGLVLIADSLAHDPTMLKSTSEKLLKTIYLPMLKLG